MLKWWKNRQALKAQASAWHRYILSRARDTHPYAQNWVDDSPEGRAAMVALIATLLFREWRKFGAKGRVCADAVSQEIFSGVDHALREQGVGDASIARRVRKMGEVFFGLAEAFDMALDEKPALPAIQAVLQRNVQADSSRSEALANWLLEIRETVHIAHLDQLP